MAEALSLFTFIFLAALPGRTTFILIMLSANGTAWRIFWGAALAFLIQVFISVLAGEALALAPSSYVKLGAGLLFLFFAYKFWIESQKPPDDFDSRVSESFKSVFALIFMAELGDVSQLAIATAATTASSKILVFFLGVMALWIITALAIFLGSSINRCLKPTVLQKAASAAFCTIGMYLCFKGCSALFG